MNQSKSASDDSPEMSTSTKGRQGAWFCNWLREGADKAMETLGPPESASKHFREARLEILRGIRELIDFRIERLSKEPRKGDRIVVE